MACCYATFNFNVHVLILIATCFSIWSHHKSTIYSLKYEHLIFCFFSLLAVILWIFLCLSFDVPVQGFLKSLFPRNEMVGLWSTHIFSITRTGQVVFQDDSNNNTVQGNFFFIFFYSCFFVVLSLHSAWILFKWAISLLDSFHQKLVNFISFRRLNVCLSMCLLLSSYISLF